MLVLDAALNSLSNGTIFNTGHLIKHGCEVQISAFWSNFFGKPCVNASNDLC